MLAEELEARGMTQRELAGAMGRPVRVLGEIVRGHKAITAETALQLEQALDIPAYFWVRLQGHYELVQARQAQKARKSA
jgi:HTH-type transcriptional regulator/antitoxin HigA